MLFTLLSDTKTFCFVFVFSYVNEKIHTEERLKLPSLPRKNHLFIHNKFSSTNRLQISTKFFQEPSNNYVINDANIRKPVTVSNCENGSHSCKVCLFWASCFSSVRSENYSSTKIENKNNRNI